MSGWLSSNPMRTLLDDAVSEDVLAEIRERLDEDLSDAERREIVQLLVRRITVHTTLPDRGRKQVRVVIDYRFPRVGEARTGIAASSQLQSLPRYRRLSRNPLATGIILRQGSTTTSPSCESPSLIAAE